MKFSWRSIGAVALATSLSLSSSAQAQVRMKFSDAATGHVTLVASGDAQIGAFDVHVSFDSELMSFKEADVGAATENAMVSANEVEPGRVKVAVVDADGVELPGDVLLLKFEAKATEEPSAELTVDHFGAYDVESLLPVAIVCESGTVRLIDEPSTGLIRNGNWKMAILVALCAAVLLIVAIVFYRRIANSHVRQQSSAAEQ